jgi:hypothetical protein
MIASLVFILAQAAAPAGVGQLVFATPVAIAEVDAGRMKGDLARLAWSPDGSEFYIQTVERDRGGQVKSARHYVVSGSAKGVRSVDQEPAWASKYWGWKSGQASPGSAAFRIAVDERQETVRSTAAPTGGALARGGGVDPLAGTTVADVASAAEQSQKKTTYRLRLAGETIGEWVNEAVIPGLNFGWAPAPMTMIAFAKRDGGPIVLLDQSGQKREMTAARSATLPAWSGDGTRIAWLERKDRKKYDLMIVSVK